MVLDMRSFTMVVVRKRGTGASKSRSSVHKGAEKHLKPPESTNSGGLGFRA